MDNYRNSMSRENLIMLIMAGAILVFNLVGFIVSYFVWKDLSKESDYIRENGRKLLNFHISFVIYEIIAGLSIIALIGVILTPIVSIAYIVLAILGMIKYGQYQDYDYAFVINFLKWLVKDEDKKFIFFLFFIKDLIKLSLLKKFGIRSI